MLQENTAEKRKHKRVAAHLPMRYRMLNEPWGAMKKGTVTCNLSRGGINFRSGEFMPKSGRIVMELDIPEKRPVKAISRVAWILRSSHGEDYSVGNQFLEISKKDEKELCAYLDRLFEKND